MLYAYHYHSFHVLLTRTLDSPPQRQLEAHADLPPPPSKPWTS